MLDVSGNVVLNLTKNIWHRKFDIRRGEEHDTPVIAHVNARKVGYGWDIETSFSNVNDEMALNFKLNTESGWGR